MSFCPAHDGNVNDQNGPNSETSKFRKSEIFLKLRNDVSMKLGYHEPLSDQIIVNIYDMCRFEKSWNVEKSSPWCSVSQIVFAFPILILCSKLGTYTVSIRNS